MVLTLRRYESQRQAEALNRLEDKDIVLPRSSAPCPSHKPRLRLVARISFKETGAQNKLFTVKTNMNSNRLPAASVVPSANIAAVELQASDAAGHQGAVIVLRFDLF